MTQAISQGFGSLLEGPAATGKTECVKELARQVGRQCIVFNCSEGLKTDVVGKLLKGMVSTGTWLCLDELNRLDLEVLSTIASHIIAIQQAVSRGRSKMVLCGTDLPVRRGGALFATLNPSYVGRVKLPDNLRSLFRSIKMLQPDYKNICSVSLYAGGYQDADRLSSIVDSVFGSMKELLSEQQHYDFRLRAIRATLKACENLQRNQEHENQNELDNAQQAILKINSPKLASQDREIFSRLVGDYFPGREAPSSAPALLLQAIRDACHHLRISPAQNFLAKTLEVYESIRLREGTIIIGESLSGKSTALKVLHEAMNRIAEKTGSHGAGLVWKIIHPTATSNAQLFGFFDFVSHDWIDGVFGKTFRDFSVNLLDEELWIVLDGPVEASWVETLNSVLDDNRKLCLPNGEIISLSPRMRIIFETDSLVAASPATVSRCAVVAFAPDTVPPKAILEASAEYSALSREAKLLIDKALHFEPSFQKQKQFILTVIRYLRLLRPSKSLREDKPPSNSLVHISMIWASSDVLFSQESQRLIRTFWKRPEDPESVFPSTERGEETWTSLSNLEKGKRLHGPFAERGLFRHSESSTRTSMLLHALIAQSVPTLLMGDPLSGKSSLLCNYLHQLSSDKFFIVRLSASRLSSAKDFEDALFPQLERRRRDGVYSGPEGKQVLLVVENLESVRSGKFCLLEALRQLCEHNSWSSCKDGSPFILTNVKIIGTCNTAANIPHRVLTKWHLIYLSFVDRTFQFLLKKLDPEDHVKIFSNYGDGIVNSNFILDEKLKLNLNSKEKTNEYIVNLSFSLSDCSIRHFTNCNNSFLEVHLSEFQFQTKNYWLYLARALKKASDTSNNMQKTFALASRWFAEGRNEDYHVWSLDKLQYQCIEKSRSHSMITALKEASDKSGYSGETHIEVLKNFSWKSSDGRLELVALQSLKNLIQTNLEDKGDAVLGSELVLTDYIVRHAALLTTSLRRTDGHAILAGRSGMGKGLTARLSSVLLDCQIEFVAPSLKFSQRGWREKLRKILFSAGLESKSVILVVPESQLWDSDQDIVLADVEVLMNCGQIPMRLFTIEEEGEILEKMQDNSREGLVSTPFERMDSFSRRIAENLHIVVTVRHDGPQLQQWLNLNPGIRNRADCHIFEDWDLADFSDLARHYIQTIQLLPEMNSTNLINSAEKLHRTCYDRATSSHIPPPTPATFLELLRVFRDLAIRKHRDVSVSKARYTTGTDRLDGAAGQVEEMKKELSQLQPRLVATSLETGRLMMQIEHETVEVESAREVVASNEATANDAATRAQAIKDPALDSLQMECEQDLAEAVPALEAAVLALNTLKQSDISTLKTLKHPPSGIKLVMSAVCILLGEKPTKVPGSSPVKAAAFDYWPTAHRILSDMKFLGRLRKLDKDSIPEEIMDLVRSKKYVGNPEFDPEKVKQASLAAEGICLWVRALEMYNRVMKVVRPKRSKLKEAEKEVKEQMAHLVSKRKDLHAVSERMQVLNDEFGKMRQKKKDLEQQIRNCEIKTDRAQRLLGGLGDEGERWKVLTRELSSVCDRFLSDSFLAAASMTYLARYGPIFRQETLETLRGDLKGAGLTVNPGAFELDSFFDNQRDLHRWRAGGLPDDHLSHYNALLVYYSRRWPLILDPQGEIKKWLQKVEGPKLSIVRSTDSNLLTTLENAITLGLRIAVEINGDELDPRMDDLIDLKFTTEGSSQQVCLGGKSVKFHGDFRLFFLRKSLEKKLEAGLFDRVCVVDFVLSSQAVEDRLLDVLVGIEAPDLQKRREELQIQSSDSRDGLSDLEEQILKLLSSTKGSVLEDEGAIEVLAQAKELADGLIKKQAAARKAEIEISSARERFRPLAQATSATFFVFLRLNRITHFYHFTLQWFIDILRSVLVELSSSTDGREMTVDNNERFSEVTDKVTLCAFKKASRSMFQRDVGVLAFCLAELKQRTRQASDGCSVMKFRKASILEKRNKQNKSTARVLLMSAAEETVRSEFDSEFSEPVPFDLGAAWADSVPSQPILLLLTSGYDPLRQLISLAENKAIGQDRLRITSLQGGEEGMSVESGVRRAAAEGWWFVLQNTHLAHKDSFFLLEKILEDLDKEQKELHKDFRLWLTANASPDYSASILQMCLKVTTEPPKGIKALLTRGYDLRMTAQLRTDASEPECFRLVCFYAALKERSKYGPIGWRGDDYFFSESDLVTSLRTLTTLNENVASVSSNVRSSAEKQKTGSRIEMLKPLVLEAYGGRISIQQDMEILSALFDAVFSERFETTRFTLPSSNDPYVISAFIRSLPIGDDPEFCGLHPLASDYLNRSLSENFERTYLRTQGLSDPESSTGFMEKRSEREQNIRNLQSSLKKAGSKIEREIEENLLLGMIQKEVREALENTDSLMTAYADGSEDWMIQRAWGLSKCLGRRKEPEMLVFELPAISKPQRLLRGLLHAEARRSGLPAHDLTISAELVEETKLNRKIQTTCVFFKGIKLTNACFNLKEWRISEISESISGNPLPLVKVSCTHHVSGDESCLEIPVYSCAGGGEISDSSPLFSIRVHNDSQNMSPAYWTLRGAYATFPK